MEQKPLSQLRKNLRLSFFGEEKFHHSLQRRIRNRSGHRPQHANRNGGDVLVASYNVHKCVGQDNIFNPQRIISVIEEIKPQILALQEVDKRFGTRQGLLDLAQLKERTGLVHVPLNACREHSHGFHGNALFCRHGRIRDIHQIDLPGMEPRGAIIVEIALEQFPKSVKRFSDKNCGKNNGLEQFVEPSETKTALESGSLRLIAAHFGLLRRSRMRQVDTILDFLATRPLMPTLMMGDLNEWRLGKGSSLNPFTSFFDVEMGTVPSFPSRFPVLALDRVFAFPQNLVASVEIHNTDLARIASDHLPLKAWIDLKNIHHPSIKDAPTPSLVDNPQALAV